MENSTAVKMEHSIIPDPATCRNVANFSFMPLRPVVQADAHFENS